MTDHNRPNPGFFGSRKQKPVSIGTYIHLENVTWIAFAQDGKQRVPERKRMKTVRRENLIIYPHFKKVFFICKIVILYKQAKTKIVFRTQFTDQIESKGLKPAVFVVDSVIIYGHQTLNQNELGIARTFFADASDR